MLDAADGLLDAIVPPGVAVVASTGAAAVPPMPDAERAAIAGARPERRAEYATVRACARAALARLGEPPAAILTGERGRPLWPAGIVGSLTHCPGYRAAAVARAAELAGIGIDAEPDAPLPPGVAEVVAGGRERAALGHLPRGPAWDRLLFCLKEATFKLWFPLTGRWLDFTEVEVGLEPGGTASVRLLAPVPAGAPLPRVLPARFAVGRGLVVAAVWAPR